MRPQKPLTFLVVITLAALCYVNLQVEQIKVGYEIKKKEEVYGRLLDQNRILRYNNLALRSPKSMEKLLLAKNINMEMPQRISIVMLERERAGVNLASSAFEKSRDFILSLFALRPEAYAKAEK